MTSTWCPSPSSVSIAGMMQPNLLSLTTGFCLASAAAAADAADLYVASYAGPVFHLSLRVVDGVDGGAPDYALDELGSTMDCGRNPAWLVMDRETGTLLCCNEAFTLPNAGSLASFSIERGIVDVGTADGTTITFRMLDNLTTDFGPAQSAFYRPGRLALAHYAGAAVSVVDTSNPEDLRELQSFHYYAIWYSNTRRWEDSLLTLSVEVMDKPGPNATLQDRPYPHGVVADPTGRFVVVLDRGADALHTYAVGEFDDRLVELGTYFTDQGIGPRHGVFVKGTKSTYFYVLGELTNSLLGFEVLYHEDKDELKFRLFHKTSAYGTPFGDSAGVALPSEIAAADAGRHIVLSIRNDNRQTYAGQPSDTIASFEVDPDTGHLSLVGLTASGGKWPRSFAVSRDGRRISVGNQYSVPGRLVVFARDPKTGVIWDEEALAVWETAVALPDGQSISNVLWDD